MINSTGDVLMRLDEILASMDLWIKPDLNAFEERPPEIRKHMAYSITPGDFSAKATSRCIEVTERLGIHVWFTAKGRLTQDSLRHDVYPLRDKILQGIIGQDFVAGAVTGTIVGEPNEPLTVRIVINLGVHYGRAAGIR